MGAYENYTGPIYNPAGDQALAQAAANIGATMGAAIEKKAALDRAEAERKRKEELAKAKERKAINQRIQAEAFSQTAAANKTLSNEIDKAGIDKELVVASLSPMMDELGQLGARLKYDTNLSGKAYAEAKQKYGKLYSALNNDLPELLDLTQEYSEATKNAAEVAPGQEGGFDAYDSSEAYYSKLVMNGKIQGKYSIVFDEDYNPMMKFTGIEGMEPFTISADSLTRPNYNIIPKGTDIARTALDDAHFSDMIKGYTTKDGAIQIIQDAKANGVNSGYKEFIGRDGSLYAQLDSSVITNKAKPILKESAINLTSDDLSGAVYYNNRLRGENDDLITLVDGQLTPEDEQKIQDAYIKQQGQKAYETSGANKAILIKSAAQLRAENAAFTDKQMQSQAINYVSSEMKNFSDIFMPSISTAGEVGEGSIAGLQPEAMKDYLIGRPLDGKPITEVEYDPNTNLLEISTVDVDVTIKDVEGKKDKGEKDTTTTTTKVKPYSFKLTKQGGGVHKLGNMLFLTTASSRQKLGGAFEEFVNTGYDKAQESFIEKAGSVDLMRAAFGLTPISPNVAMINTDLQL